MVSVEPFKGSLDDSQVITGDLSGDPKWPVFHFADDHAAFNIWVVLSCPLSYSVTATFEITGTAQPNVHYAPPLGPGQVVFDPGNTRKGIRITPLSSGLYYEEVSLTLALTGITTGGAPQPGEKDAALTLLENELEVHAYFRPATGNEVPITIEWTTPATPAAGIGTVVSPVCSTVGAVNVGTVNQDKVNIWLEQTNRGGLNAAVEGVDFLFGTLSGLDDGTYITDPGRIAYSVDGNIHDKDDWGATAMALAILWKAGLQARLVHYDYNNHLGTTTVSWEAEMVTSATGNLAGFGFTDPSVFIDCTPLGDAGAAAVAHLANEISISSASSPLTIIEGGMWEVLCQAFEAATLSKHQYVTIITHSNFNDTHESPHGSGRVRADFEEWYATGLTDNDWTLVAPPTITPIFDQNGTAFRTLGAAYWNWMQSLTANEQFVYDRTVASAVAAGDMSDAGMTFWLLTGVETAVMLDIEDFFNHVPVSGVLVNPNGGFTINTNSNQRTCFISILSTATSTRVLELTLMHEPSDRSEENFWSFSKGWAFDYRDDGIDPGNGSLGAPVFPGEPGDLAPGPASAEPPNAYLTIREDLVDGKKDPWGDILYGLRQRAQAINAGYVRKDSEVHVQCGQPVGTSLIPMPAYNRFSVYVEVPTIGAGEPGTGFLELTRIGFRERGASYAGPVQSYSSGTNYQAVFRRNFDDGGSDFNGDTVVAHGSGRWGVDSSSKDYNGGGARDVEAEFRNLGHGTPLRDVITRDSGSWVTDGFNVGQTISVWDTLFNDGNYTVDAVTATILTLVSGDVLTSETVTCNVSGALPLDSACGVVTETWRNGVADETTLMRLWLTVHEDDSVSWEAQHIGNQQNVINWPVFDDYGTVIPGAVGDNLAVNRRFLFFWPVWEHSATTNLVTAPLPRYWPRPALQWEPRGRACVVAGGNNVHTITIA